MNFTALPVEMPHHSLWSQALLEVFHTPKQPEDVCYFGVDVISMGVFDRVKGTQQHLTSGQ